MTVNLTWDETWLSLFEKMDSPTKKKFLQEVEIIELVKSVNEATQIEILAEAPKVLVKYLIPHLRAKTVKKLLAPQITESIDSVRRKLPDKVYVDMLTRCIHEERSKR